MLRKEMFIYGLCGACAGLIVCNAMLFYSYDGTKKAYDDELIENAQLRKDIVKKDTTIASLENELSKVKQSDAK